MNWFDRAIGAVAPGAGLRRARQRQAIGILARAYDGARLGRRTEGWIAAGTGANAEIASAIARLRDRSRDLVRNNPYAAKAVTALVSNMVGTGLLPRARAAEPELAAQADRLWSAFAAHADADGLTNFAGLQALIVRSLVESGEVLVRLRERHIEPAHEFESSLSVPSWLQDDVENFACVDGPQEIVCLASDPYEDLVQILSIRREWTTPADPSGTGTAEFERAHRCTTSWEASLPPSTSRSSTSW